jgi:hypothetical protein
MDKNFKLEGLLENCHFGGEPCNGYLFIKSGLLANFRKGMTKTNISNGACILNSSHVTICLRTLVIVDRFVPSSFT